jgi:hypothetical protein
MVYLYCHQTEKTSKKLKKNRDRKDRTDQCKPLNLFAVPIAKSSFKIAEGNGVGFPVTTPPHGTIAVIVPLVKAMLLLKQPLQV